MKVTFNDRLEAIDWIARYTDDEGQFEVLREQLSMNFILTGDLYLKIDSQIGEVVLLQGRMNS